MSKSSKRRLAIAAIKNATDTAASPHRTTDLPVGVPSPSTSPLSSAPSAPAPLSPSTPSAFPSAPKTLQEILAEPPSEFFKPHLEPHCPPEQVDSILLPAILPDPNNPAGPIDSQLQLYQSKLGPIFAKLSPDDPSVERISHNYVVVMQIATVERMIHSLPGLSESAQLETNNQIVRMLSIIERTNSRRARELREKDAAARRIIREQQRQERQAQKEADTIARNQRAQEREEQRRQREKAKADRAEQSHQLAIRKLDLKERNLKLDERERQLDEKNQHSNFGTSTERPSPSSPVPNACS